MFIPKIAAVHDLSCVGRCSLSVIIPTLAKLGAQVCPLPTSILSSHLGGYHNISITDCTEKMSAIYGAWEQENINFDCIYTGYLASHAQISTVEEFIYRFSKDSLVVIDPVMGDHGKLYSKYTPDMQRAMRSLVHKARLITPNYTEACFLLEEEYIGTHRSLELAYSYLLRLADFGIEQVVITGIRLIDGRIANVAYDSSTQSFFTAYSPLVGANYPGTGDIFTSVLLGYLLLDLPLDIALLNASQFAYECISLTYSLNTPVREGVLLELLLDSLNKEGVGCEN